MFGGFTSNVDMKSGAPAFGTPEYVKATLAGGQIARAFRLPYRASNVNASNAVDAQSTYESGMSLMALRPRPRAHGASRTRVAGGRAHRIVREDGGRCRDDPGVGGDAEAHRGRRGCRLALDTIKGVAPGGHFFGPDAYARAVSRRRSTQPIISDWRNYQAWEDRRRQERDASGRTRSTSGFSRNTRRRPWIRPSTRRSRRTWPSEKRNSRRSPPRRGTPCRQRGWRDVRPPRRARSPARRGRPPGTLAVESGGDEAPMARLSRRAEDDAGGRGAEADCFGHGAGRGARSARFRAMSTIWPESTRRACG